MTQHISQRQVKSIAHLLEFIREDVERTENQVSAIGVPPFLGIWFRGLPSTGFTLVPTLHRRGLSIGDEAHLMNRFKQNAFEFLTERPQGEWEWMLIARHHGLPSRLMDWSESVLVALYFAIADLKPDQPRSDGSLWCLSPQLLNWMASRQTLRWDGLPILLDDEVFTDQDQFISLYKTSRVFDARSTVPVPPAAAMSIRTTKRIQAQQGVFTVHHADSTPIEDLADSACLWNYVIPSSAKPSIREELRLSGITELTLFPELDEVALEAGRPYSA